MSANVITKQCSKYICCTPSVIYDIEVFHVCLVLIGWAFSQRPKYP